MEPQKTAPAPDEPPPPPLLLTEGEFIKQYIAAKDAGQAALLAFAAKIGKRTIQDWDCKYYAPIASTAKKGIKVVLGNDPSVIVWCFLARSDDISDLQLIESGTSLKFAGILSIDPDGLRFSKCKFQAHGD